MVTSAREAWLVLYGDRGATLRFFWGGGGRHISDSIWGGEQDTFSY